MLSLKILNRNGEVRFKAYGDEIDEHFHGAYEEGDRIRIDLNGEEFLKVCLDPTLAESLIYVPDGTFEFVIPFGYERRACYAPDAFAGDDHRLRCAVPDEPEIYGSRKISLNSHDRHNIPKYFPHAVANFVTRENKQEKD